MSMPNICYTGQRRSLVSGNYLLGNGYRGFNPVLKRFAGQDSMSPFGAGGEHGFAYCGGNPINQSDPSGHLFKWLYALLGRKTVKKTTKAAETEVVKNVVADALGSPEITDKAITSTVPENKSIIMENNDVPTPDNQADDELTLFERANSTTPEFRKKYQNRDDKSAAAEVYRLAKDKYGNKIDSGEINMRAGALAKHHQTDPVEDYISTLSPNKQIVMKVGQNEVMSTAAANGNIIDETSGTSAAATRLRSK